MWSKLPKPVRVIIIAALYAALWQAASLLVGSPLKLPSPLLTLRTFFKLAATGYFWASIAVTLARICAGFLMGMIAGVLLAALSVTSSFIADLITPALSLIKATPVSSFILLALLWLSGGLTPVLISFLMVIPMVFATVRRAILDVPSQLVEMTKFFGLPLKRRLKLLYIPSVKPQFIASATTALGFAWKSGVAAEVLSTPRLSIGRSIYESKLYLETPQLFAWTAAVILLSVLIEKVFVWLIRGRV